MVTMYPAISSMSSNSGIAVISLLFSVVFTCPNTNEYGVARDFRFKINDIVINQGAEFIVAIAGEMMRMPGLPADPQARRIDLVDGKVEGLS